MKRIGRKGFRELAGKAKNKRSKEKSDAMPERGAYRLKTNPEQGLTAPPVV